MLTSTVQSAPCATPEAANDALAGLLLQAGQNQNIKVISTDVHEVDGLWVAVAFFQIEQLEEDDEPDEKPTNEDEVEGIELRDDNDVFLWHGMAREQVPEPSPAKDFPDTEAPTTPVEPIPQEFLQDNVSAPTYQSEEPNLIKVAEDIQNDFKKAEELANDINEPTAPIYIPASTDTPIYDDRTFEERREEEEQREEQRALDELESLRQRAIPLPVEGPAEPAPSDS